MIVIGIDAAVSAVNVGVAVADWDGRVCTLLETFHGVRGRMCDWLPDRLGSLIASEEAGLIAIDAPLGWPKEMLPLVEGFAGKSLASPSRSPDPFWRRTDNLVRYLTGKVPLAVGADRVARTAAASLAFLGEVRSQSGRALPLAWSAKDADHWGVIEVYPAATMAARLGVPRPPDRISPEQIEGFVLGQLRVDEELRRGLGVSRHVLDASVAVVAAQDFLRGDVQLPYAADEDRARQEGWIWCYAPRFCRPCSLPRIAEWRGCPRGFGPCRANTPAVPDLPVLSGGTCPNCGGSDGVPMDHFVFQNVHGPDNTGLPDFFVIEMQAPPGHHGWLERHGIPLPYSSASRLAGTKTTI